ncbi:beta-lactamase domain protein [Thalassoporum mexicanum PCC 7367]|nr:beta-lactamase domain protein [Pseudanabaena sp. PCC 7367]
MRSQALRLAATALAAMLTFFGIIGWHNYIPAVQAQEAQETIAPASIEARLNQANLTLAEVGSGVYALVADTDFPPASEDVAISNGGIVIGNEGVLVIDPFQSKDLGNLILDVAASLTEQPVLYVLNTHYHFDHTGGNPAAGDRGIPIIGRGLIREFIATNNKAYDPSPKLPDLIVNSETEIWLGGRQVQIERVEGHSGGTDLIAYVPDAGVLFTGDIVFHQRFPYLGDGDIRELQGSLYRLIVTFPDATVVPGHGPVTDLSGIKGAQEYIRDLERMALDWKAQDLSREEAFAQSAIPPAKYSDFKFQAMYGPNDIGLKSNLEVAYDQITQSARIPLIP